MIKLFASKDRPDLTETAWIRELAEPSEPVDAEATETRPYYGALTAAGDARDAASRTGAHCAVDAADTSAPTTEPIARLSADQVDRLIHRLDREIGTTGAHADATTANAEAPAAAGTVTTADGALTTFDGAVTTFDGAVTTFDGAVTAPDGAVTTPGGAVTSTDSSTMYDTVSDTGTVSDTVSDTGTVSDEDFVSEESAVSDARDLPDASIPPAHPPAVPKPATARGRARKPLLVVAAVTLFALTVGGGTMAAMDKTVSVVVDGSPRQITTLSRSVSGALAAAGITPGAHDAIAPAGDASISDGSTIVVDRGRLLTLTVDGKPRRVWTTARTVDEALTLLGVDPGTSPGANRSRQIPLEGLAVSASTPHTVKVSVAGRSATSATSAATTVGQLLTAQQVTVGPTDRVTPSLTTPLTDGLLISVDRIAIAPAVITRSMPQPAGRTVPDADIAKGTSKIVGRGHAGSQTISYEVTTVNGRQTVKREVARKTVVAPVATVTHVGTKVAPVAPAPLVVTKVAPVKPQNTFTYSGSEVFTNDTSFGVNWDGLAMCESTHNPQAVNANPSAGLPTYGMFQFDLPTWESVGGSGNPIDASPEEQLMRAKVLYQSRGLEPWACRDSAH